MPSSGPLPRTNTHPTHPCPAYPLALHVTSPSERLLGKRFMQLTRAGRWDASQAVTPVTPKLARSYERITNASRHANGEGDP